MSTGSSLQLRDIHLPAEPGWWPPAPGWWALAAVLLVLGWLAFRALRRSLTLRDRRRQLMRALDAQLASTPPEAEPLLLLAGMSELLRRACREYARPALGLAGEAWLVFLDGDDPGKPFSEGAGRILLDGPYRRSVEASEVVALVPAVRARLRQLAERSHA